MRQPVQNRICQRRLPQSAQRQAGQRHAKLHRRQKLIEIVFESERRSRARTILRNQLLDPRLSHADQRKLRSHKEAVRQDKEGDQASVNKTPFQHRWPKVYTGRSNGPRSLLAQRAVHSATS